MIRSIQEQEEMDYQPASEFQNALSMSRMELNPDDTNEISNHLDKGKYVVVRYVDVFCSRTDAYLTTQKLIFSVHDTSDDAIAEVEKNMELDLGILPKVPIVEVKPETIEEDDPCPF
jgi:hypothetical protein